MDSSTAEQAAHNAERARLTTSSAGDDVDHISDLDDDVLLRVLALLPDASDLARTATLSRRWLGLWTRVPALRFASRPGFAAAGAEQRTALERYAAFVDGVLARRVHSDCAIESLSIVYTAVSRIREQRTPAFVPDPWVVFLSCAMVLETECDMQELMPACVHAVQGWIQIAFRHEVKSFSLDLRLPPLSLKFLRDHGGDENVILLDSLASPDKIETLHLALGGARLRLPSTIKFASLAHLSLEGITIAAGGAHLLGRLVSSASCPHLQKLCMREIYLHDDNEEMRLEADVLSELWMDNIVVLMSLKLKLRTPRLRVLHMYKCSYEVLTISAPRLEELGASFQPGKPPRRLEIQGELQCVRNLKICLWSHRPCGSSHYETENDSIILLLKHCGSLTCLDVALQGQEDDVDIIKSRAPELPHITSLTVNVSNWFDRHDFGAGVASLLTRFNNLRHLSLHLPISLGLDCYMPEGSDLPCDHPDHWKFEDISMAYLLELELTGFTGTDCELWFMKSVLRTAKRVSKVAISFNKSRHEHQGKMDAFLLMLYDEGMWASYRDEHMLTCLR